MITNFKDLAKTPLREKALKIIDAGYEAIEIEAVLKKKIVLKGNILTVNFSDAKNRPRKVRVDLSKFEKVVLVGFGKSSALATAYIAKILGNRLALGAAIDIEKPNFPVQSMEFLIGTHPLPSEDNVQATQKIITLVKSLTAKDLLIVFTCGGGSALATATADELDASRQVISALTRLGADIIELNTVRKHLSIFKGGGLAKLAYPARVLSLIVSDVLGNDLSMIASGPLALDKTKVTDAQKILRKYKLKPENFKLLETPKNRKFFKNIKTALFVKNTNALVAMEKKAKELGFRAKIESSILKGEAKNILLPLIKAVKSGEVIIAGGESTAHLNTKSGKIGKGGRNLEAVLGAIGYLSNKYRITSNNTRIFEKDSRGRIREGFKNVVVVSFASDAHDNTEAAGAIADHLTAEKSKHLKVGSKIFLSNHDSFSFFEQTGDLIFAERNCFNVSDLMLVLRDSKG